MIKKLIFVFFVGYALILPSATYAAVSCTDITYTLSQGSKDSLTQGQVTLLQTYLYAKGYLSASPTGHFGPATETALKKLQTKNGISATGATGPLTRTAIKDASCTTATETTTIITTPTVVTPVVTTTSNVYYTVTAPAAGDTLVTGDSFTIAWNGVKGNSFIATLEDMNGVGKGFIASSLYQSKSYTWKVGRVLKSDTQIYTFVPPGRYRIHIQDLYSNSHVADEYSQPFTITAKPLSLSTVMPRSLPNDSTTPGVLYGSGFTDTTVIRFDTSTGLTASTLYRSPDGTILVFAIPSNIYPSMHTLMVQNSYTDSNDNVSTTTPSNSLDILVTKGD